MNPGDEVFLVAFSDRPRLVSGFTGDVEEIRSKLVSLQPGGLTALLDGAEMALREMKKAKNPRKAILIISDGGDNNSRYSSVQVQQLVREADVQLYGMGVGVLAQSCLPKTDVFDGGVFRRGQDDFQCRWKQLPH
jgi:Ca-activated chloride channel family protein